MRPPCVYLTNVYVFSVYSRESTWLGFQVYTDGSTHLETVWGAEHLITLDAAVDIPEWMGMVKSVGCRVESGMCRGARWMDTSE